MSEHPFFKRMARRNEIIEALSTTALAGNEWSKKMLDLIERAETEAGEDIVIDHVEKTFKSLKEEE